MTDNSSNDTSQGGTVWNRLQGFGALSETNIPKRMRNVREQLRDEWSVEAETKQSGEE